LENATENLLKIQNLTKRYGSETILKNLSLDIQDGEFLIILGSSGSGKSTLLRVIAGLEPFDEGDLFLKGVSIGSKSPSQRNLAMVFQNFALYPHMTVEENISFCLKNFRLPPQQIKKRVEEVSETLVLKDLLKRKPNELSGGQQQRVAIGRALVRQPSMYLFDEPLCNLDTQLKEHLIRELSDLFKKLKTTMIYVTHSEVEAMSLGTRMVILAHGELQQVGTPEEIYYQPANQYVARFIGTPKMNFFQGRLEVSGHQKRFLTENEVFDFSKAQTPLQTGPYCLGVRPEDLKIITKSGPESYGTPDFSITKKFVEFRGFESQVMGYLKNKFEVTLKLTNPNRLRFQKTVPFGHSLNVLIDRSRLHWFNPTSTQRVESATLAT
jgi:ABC-type sugar transport system ATPase subunit